MRLAFVSDLKRNRRNPRAMGQKEVSGNGDRATLETDAFRVQASGKKEDKR